MNNKEKTGKEETEKTLLEELEIPEGVSVEINNGLIIVKGEKGEIKKSYPHKTIIIKVEEKDGKKVVVLTSQRTTQREYKVIKTFKSHIKNMMKGVKEGFVYKLKVCSTHFPMKVSLSGDTLKVENFMGERHPRTLRIKQGAKVKIDGHFIIVESHDKELAGQVAADIEQLTRITNRDRRIFQDGIFIVEKAGKPI